MVKTRDKTLSYRRAVWLQDQKGVTLEDFIKKAHAALGTVGERKFNRGDGQFIKAAELRAESGGGYFLHLVAETPGDHASTLSKNDESKAVSKVATSPPPNGQEYMDGDIFGYVRGDNVCICSTTLRDAALAKFLYALFEKADLGDESSKFDIQKVANIDKLKLIQKEGVKEIDINCTLYDASLKYSDRKDMPGVWGVIRSHLSALFIEDGSGSEDNLKMRLSIVTDGRMTGQKIGKERILSLAKGLVESDEDYSIVTQEGQRITASQVFVRTQTKIERLGKSVNRDQAWAELKSFYRNLHNTGITAQ